MSREDWRSPSAYEYSAGLEAGDIAWEFLRRNRDYQSAYTAEIANGDRGTDYAARHWGLRLPG